MNAALTFESIHFGISGREILSCVDLTLEAGQAVRVAGCNGAGKTTILRLAANHILPNSGSLVYGSRVLDAKGGWKNGIGFMPADFSAPLSLTASEYFALLVNARGIDRRKAVAVIAGDVSLLQMESFVDHPMGTYSTGMLKKAAFVAATLHSPHLWILDEPFESLDSLAVSAVCSRIADQRKNGGAIIFASHLGHLESVSSRQVEIVDGRLTPVHV